MSAAKSLPRRVRSAPPAPRVRRLILSDADYLLVAAIDRHGPLPSHYLFEFTKHLRRDQTHLQNRLTEFYNGDKSGQLLTRPVQQFASYRGRYQHLVYGLAPRARRLLAERGLLTSYSRLRIDPFVHRVMAACVSASFELSAPAFGLRYIGLQEILDRPGCLARDHANPLALPVPGSAAHAIIPDLLFGLEYPGIGYRFFAVEIDRNTESIERRNLRQSAFARKLEAYTAILGSQSFRAWWGIPNLHVLTVTTNAIHEGNIVEFVRSHCATLVQDRFAFQANTAFGADWTVPSGILTDLIGGAWRTIEGVRDISRANAQARSTFNRHSIYNTAHGRHVVNASSLRSLDQK